MERNYFCSKFQKPNYEKNITIYNHAYVVPCYYGTTREVTFR